MLRGIERLLKKKNVLNVMMECPVCGRKYCVSKHTFMTKGICPICGDLMFLTGICTYPEELQEVTFAGRWFRNDRENTNM